MTADVARSGTEIDPAEAFALLGNDIRVAILSCLGDADASVPFAELRRAVGVDQGAQFNYHLNRLVGHYVAKTEDGYELTQTGRRVVNAVLSGAVTGATSIEPTHTELPCTRCHSPTFVEYRDEAVRITCTSCEGNYGVDVRPAGSDDAVEPGYLGSLPVPPAAVRGRSMEDLYFAATVWGHAYLLTLASGVCPECGSTVDRWIEACAAHDPIEGVCPACDGVHQTRARLDCSHCLMSWTGRTDNGIFATTAVQRFLLNHGINVLDPSTNIWSQFAYEEEVVNDDPLLVRISLTVNDDRLSVVVDDALQIDRVEEP